jgi:hypothetical protein
VCNPLVGREVGVRPVPALDLRAHRSTFLAFSTPISTPDSTTLHLQD